jgi:hypothetical protein
MRAVHRIARSGRQAYGFSCYGQFGSSTGPFPSGWNVDMRRTSGHRRVRSESARARRQRVLLAVGGLTGSFCVTLGIFAAVRHDGSSPPATSPSGAASQVRGAKGDPSPRLLDRQWLTYSDHSTCADRSGGDGVAAVRLTATRTAWFFSDSWLGPAGPKIGFSKKSGFVHNLVVMQTNSGGKSTFVTITGGHACPGPRKPRQPRAVVSAAGQSPPGQRYWVGSGIRAGSQVLTFYNKYLAGGSAHAPEGTAIASFPVSKLISEGDGPAYGEVIRPHLTTLPSYTPPGGGIPIMWGTTIMRLGPTAYIYGWQSPSFSSTQRVAYLARVAVSLLGNFSDWRFYAGAGQWAAGQQNARPVQIGPNLALQTAFSVSRIDGRYWLIEQAGEIGGADIDAYPAAHPWGPFDPAAAIVLYQAPGIGLTAADNYQIMYDAAAEPALSDHRTLMISYDVNSEAVNSGCRELSSYTNAVTQPRFVAVPVSAFRAAAATAESDGAAAVHATAGHLGYPPIVARQPAQWFDAWSTHGCPPVPPVRAPHFRQSGGMVLASWPSAGLGVEYQVYVRQAGASQYQFLRAVSWPHIQLRHLAGGRSYQLLVVPVNINDRSGQSASAIFTTR